MADQNINIKEEQDDGCINQTCDADTSTTNAEPEDDGVNQAPKWQVLWESSTKVAPSNVAEMEQQLPAPADRGTLTRTNKSLKGRRNAERIPELTSDRNELQDVVVKTEPMENSEEEEQEQVTGNHTIWETQQQRRMADDAVKPEPMDDSEEVGKVRMFGSHAGLETWCQREIDDATIKSEPVFFEMSISQGQSLESSDVGTSGESLLLKRKPDQDHSAVSLAKRAKEPDFEYTFSKFMSGSMGESPYPVCLIKRTGVVPSFYPITNDKLVEEADSDQDAPPEQKLSHDQALKKQGLLKDDSKEFSGYVPSGRKQTSACGNAGELSDSVSSWHQQASTSVTDAVTRKEKGEFPSYWTKDNLDKLFQSKEKLIIMTRSRSKVSDESEVYLDNAEDGDGESLFPASEETDDFPGVLVRKGSNRACKTATAARLQNSFTLAAPGDVRSKWTPRQFKGTKVMLRGPAVGGSSSLSAQPQPVPGLGAATDHFHEAPSPEEHISVATNRWSLSHGDEKLPLTAKTSSGSSAKQTWKMQHRISTHSCRHVTGTKGTDANPPMVNQSQYSEEQNDTWQTCREHGKQGEEAAVKRGPPSDSKQLVLDGCRCTQQSQFEIAEENLWRAVKHRGLKSDEPTQLKNLGLLRFMNKNLFSFTKDGNLFVHLAEVQYRGLLPVHNVDKCFILSYPVWRLVSSELRKASRLEQLYLESYGIKKPAAWLRFMITPHGLHTLYRLLDQKKKNNRWFALANSLFCQQKLAHHCPWTLQVTPPTGRDIIQKQNLTYPTQRIREVVKTLTRVHLNPISKKQTLVAVTLSDGGAGTSIDNHDLSPLLGDALKNLISTFQLEDIAEPFCSCNLNIKEDFFRPVHYGGVVVYHVTEMQFVSKETPLHCWKRNNGFFASLDELLGKFFLPSNSHEALAKLLASATVGCDICYMLKPELLFLEMKASFSGGKKCLTRTRVEAIIERAEYYMKQEKHSKQDTKIPRSMKGVLINLAYLRKMYLELAKSVPWLKPHARSKFYIKHWSHMCPSKKNGQHEEQEMEEGQKLVEELEESDPEEVTELPEHLPERCGEEGKENGRVEDRVDEEEETGDDDKHQVTSGAEKEAGNDELQVDNDEAEDVQILEDVEEAENEIINLVDSSSEDEDKSDYGEEDHGQSWQAEDGVQGHLGAEADFVHPEDKCSEAALQSSGTDEMRHIKQESESKEGSSAAGFAQPQQAVRQEDAGQMGTKQEEAKQENDDLRCGCHDLEHISYDLGYAEQPQKAMGDIEMSHIKQEKLEEVDSDLLDLNIKQEVSEADEYLSNLPIAIIPNLATSQMPGVLQEPCTDQTHAVAKQIPEEEEEEEEGAEEDSDSDSNKAVSFKTEDFPRLCSCPDGDQNNVLSSSSILQSYFNSRNNCVYVLEHVGQAAIGEHLLYTFSISETLYFSLAQLQDLGLVLSGVHIDCFRSRGPSHWVQRGNVYEIAFLCNNGVSVPLGSSMMHQTRMFLLSVELFCFLSYEGQLVTLTVRQSDICLSKIGHICPHPSSRAWQVMQKNTDLGMVMKAWSKSFFWQEQLKGVEERRLVGHQPTKQEYSHCPTISFSKAGATNTELSWTNKQPIVVSGKIKIPVPNLPQKNERPIFKSFKSYTASECALYIRRCKEGDLQVDYKACPISSSTYYVCSPNTEGGASIIKRKTVEIEVPQKAYMKEGVRTNIYEGAMLPKWFKDKNQCLKTGVGFVELDTTAINSWIGDKSSTHHLLLTGTLTTGITAGGQSMTFSCFKINGKLYINWGELAAQTVGVSTIYALARKLFIFLYGVPTLLGVHFSRHYGASTDMVCSKPWLCVNSVNAVAWLGIIDKVSHRLFPKTFSVLVNHFHKTDNWNLQFRNFLLIPKGELMPKETFLPR